MKSNSPRPPRALFLSTMFALSLSLALQTASQATEPSKPKITISKETTYITGPLRPDGYPDYVAALNEIASRGVMVENNAAVLIMQALGPEVVPEQRREEFFKRLGMKPLEIKGEYLLDYSELYERWKKGQLPGAEQPDEVLRDQYNAAIDRPWSENEFPTIAEWLTLNEEPLKLITEASKRPRCYFPSVVEDPKTGLVGVSMRHPGAMRDATRSFITRAMLRIKQGKHEQAFEDLLTIRRLALLLDEGTSIIDGLVAVTVQNMGAAAEGTFAHYAQLTAKEAIAYRVQLEKITPNRSSLDKFNVGERFMLLDSICLCYRDCAEEGPMKGDSTDKLAIGLEGAYRARMLDVNHILRLANRWYDRYATAIRNLEMTGDSKELKALGEEFERKASSLKSPTSIALDWFTKRTLRAVVSERLGYIFLAIFTPAMEAVYKANLNSTVHHDMSRIAFALAAYRADKNRYPNTLEQLVPNYLPSIPPDPFRPGTFLNYRREDTGYVVYSVGTDGIDDGGTPYNSKTGREDFILQQPAPPPMAEE